MQITDRFSVPDYIEEILARFEDAGIAAFCVGGCVRDALRGVVPHDFDLCTAAAPEVTRTLFSDHPCIDTGIRHGTLTVLWNHVPVEITTYRVDGDYAGHRAPIQVQFTDSLFLDCQRRDFTINAMAYHPKYGLYDFFDGRTDLIKQVIRCVGDPHTRFSEDALRMLRALRFSSVLDFDIEEKTACAIHENALLLTEISGERITAELWKMLCGTRASALMTEYADLIAVFLPMIKHAPADARFQKETLHRIYSCVTDPTDRLAVILYLSGVQTHEAICASLKRLKLDHKTHDKLVQRIHDTAQPPPMSRYEVHKMLSSMGEARTKAYLIMRGALYPEDGAACQKAQNDLDEICRDGGIVTKASLALSGSDLLHLGYHGKEIGDMLALLLELVLCGTLPNERQELYEKAASLVTKKPE